MKRLTLQIGLYISPELGKKVWAKVIQEDRKLSEVIRSLLKKWTEGKIEV